MALCFLALQDVGRLLGLGMALILLRRDANLVEDAEHELRDLAHGVIGVTLVSP